MGNNWTWNTLFHYLYKIDIGNCYVLTAISGYPQSRICQRQSCISLKTCQAHIYQNVFSILDAFNTYDKVKLHVLILDNICQAYNGVLKMHNTNLIFLYLFFAWTRDNDFISLFTWKYLLLFIAMTGQEELFIFV